MAQQQNYKNHIRFYWPHHFVFYPVMLLCMAGCTIHAWQTGWNPLWIALGIAFACITWLAYMLRQHYALTVQNRIVLLELRYRYFVTTGQRLEPLEAKLTEGQLFALRFAPDDELPALAQRAIAEGLSPDAIKKDVIHWQADYRRV
jgi:hypothetical protein